MIERTHGTFTTTVSRITKLVRNETESVYHDIHDNGDDDNTICNNDQQPHKHAALMLLIPSYGFCVSKTKLVVLRDDR